MPRNKLPNHFYDEQVRYPNQKRVIFKNIEDYSENYFYFKRDVLQRAAQILDAGPFKLYVYLISCSIGDECGLNLSQIAVERTFGMKHNQYYLSIKKLIDAGYLYQPDPSINYYMFNANGFDCEFVGVV